jgi:hypothetical protein
VIHDQSSAGVSPTTTSAARSGCIQHPAATQRLRSSHVVDQRKVCSARPGSLAVRAPQRSSRPGRSHLLPSDSRKGESYVCGERGMKRPAQLAILVIRMGSACLSGRARTWTLLACLVAAGAACSQAPAVGSPRTKPPGQRSLAQAATDSSASAQAKKGQALPSFAPLAPPSGIKHSLTQVRWLVFAIVGTGIVFLTAFGSRRLYALSATARSGTRRKAAPRHVTSRAAPNGAPREPDLSRRRCLLPGCHHADHLPVGRRPG